jgi:anti-anti-sigma factor
VGGKGCVGELTERKVAVTVLVQEFHITEDQVEDRVVVHLHGELDVSSCGVLRARLGSLIDRGVRDLMVDLSGISFIDSAELGVLIGALKRLQSEDGRLSLTSPSRGVRKVLEITGLNTILEIS